jgi:hypothetical protein
MMNFRHSTDKDQRTEAHSINASSGEQSIHRAVNSRFIGGEQSIHRAVNSRFIGGEQSIHRR